MHFGPSPSRLREQGLSWVPRVTNWTTISGWSWVDLRILIYSLAWLRSLLSIRVLVTSSLVDMLFLPCPFPVHPLSSQLHVFFPFSSSLLFPSFPLLLPSLHHLTLCHVHPSLLSIFKKQHPHSSFWPPFLSDSKKLGSGCQDTRLKQQQKCKPEFEQKWGWSKNSEDQ